METKVCTDFLFADSSFLTGAATIGNLPGNFYQFNSSETETEADLKAIRCDWKMIGRDLEIVFSKFGKDNPQLHECSTTRG